MIAQKQKKARIFLQKCGNKAIIVVVIYLERRQFSVRVCVCDAVLQQSLKTGVLN